MTNGGFMTLSLISIYRYVVSLCIKMTSLVFCKLTVYRNRVSSLQVPLRDDFRLCVLNLQTEYAGQHEIPITYYSEFT